MTLGVRVTSIGYEAFSDCTGLTSVTIGNGVTRIGDYAFSRCTGLTSITIPDSVTSIGEGAFASCISLTGIRMPSSVSEWGDYSCFYGMNGLWCTTGPFEGCTSLTNAMIDHGVRTIPGGAFVCCTSLTNVAIPDSVTSIGARAFSGCTSLTSITIPNSVTEFELAVVRYISGYGGRCISEAFAGCTSLTNVVISDTVTSIWGGAFEGCTGLTSITIPDSVTSIGDRAFRDCTGLQEVCFRGNAPGDEGSIFSGCPATIYYLPGTAGWGANYSDRPTAPWVLPNPVILGFGDRFGVRTNRFGFVISWATNDIAIAVEACTDPTQSVWAPVGSVSLDNGSAYFSDADWANHAARFYRVRSE